MVLLWPMKQAFDAYQHKAVHRQYQEQKPKKQAAFAEQHHAQITLLEAAERYLKGVMNGRTSLPIKAWKAEREKLMDEKKRLNREYTLLKDETAAVERIRKNVNEIMRTETRETQSEKNRDMKI